MESAEDEAQKKWNLFTWTEAGRYQQPGEEIREKQLPVERLKSESTQTAAEQQGNNANSDEYQKLKLNCVR